MAATDRAAERADLLIDVTPAWQRCLTERSFAATSRAEKNAAMVKIMLPEDNDQIIAATHRRCLPTEADLAAELERERTEVERVLRLTAPAANGVSSEP